MTRECTVSGCDKKHKANGYCAGHYKRDREGKEITTPLKESRKGMGLSHGASLYQVGCKCNICVEWAKEYHAQRRLDFRVKLAEIKLKSGCVDCGYCDHACALQFDHIGDNKEFTIAASSTVSWDSVLAEIAKCEVVCANCHFVRTQQRAGRPLYSFDEIMGGWNA